MAWLSLFVLVIGLSSADWEQFVEAMADLVTMNEVPMIFYLMIGLGLVVIAFLPSLTMLRAMRLYSGYAIADREVEMELERSGIAHQRARAGDAARLGAGAAGVSCARTICSWRSAGVRRWCCRARAFASPAEFVGATAYARARIAASTIGSG